MEKKNIFVVGGSSGIGLEVVRKLNDDFHEIFVGSRTSESLVEFPDVRHLKLDVTQDSLDFEGLPESLQGLVYCPGSILLKPFK